MFSKGRFLCLTDYILSALAILLYGIGGRTVLRLFPARLSGLRFGLLFNHGRYGR